MLRVSEMSQEVVEGVGAVALSEDVVTASTCDNAVCVLDSKKKSIGGKMSVTFSRSEIHACGCDSVYTMRCNIDEPFVF